MGCTLVHAGTVKMGLQWSPNAPGPRLLLGVSVQSCPLTPEIVHQLEPDALLTSAVNVPAVLLPPHQSSYISVRPKKSPRLTGR